ncbi:MAG: hypothetical protein JSS35_06385 [Proteobacteria bacterium]|nr:hypothetical protein [Pseudomonadota bacterium]
MQFPDLHVAAQRVRRIRQAAAALRRTVAETPACAAGFGALVGGLAATGLLNELGVFRAVVDGLAPGWAIVAGAEAAGAAIALAKLANRRTWS